jgi:hypothetical protein
MSILSVSWSTEAYTNVPTCHLVSYLLTASISSSERFSKSPKVGLHRTCHMSTAEPLPVIIGEVAANQHTRNHEIVPFVPNHMLTYKKFALQIVFLKTFRCSARPHSIKKCAEYIATI